jgi:hypothetical protein
MSKGESLKISRWFYWWIGLAIGIFALSLHGIRWSFQLVAIYDSNRWLHFLAYAALSAVPVAAFKRVSSVILSLFPGIVLITIESLQSDPSWVIVRDLITPANLFGCAAGILLGLNLRASIKAGTAAGGPVSDIAHATKFQFQHGQGDGEQSGAARNLDEERVVNV